MSNPYRIRRGRKSYGRSATVARNSPVSRHSDLVDAIDEVDEKLELEMKHETRESIVCSHNKNDPRGAATRENSEWSKYLWDYDLSIDFHHEKDASSNTLQRQIVGK